MPPRPPISAFIEAININNKELINEVNENRISKGISFCHVINIKHLSQFKPDITFGNQKWQGAIPSLIIRPKIRIVGGKYSIIG